MSAPEPPAVAAALALLRETLRVRRVPPGAGAGRRGAARGPVGARGLPDRRRQEPLLPAPGAAARRRDARRLAADRADEGSDRLPRAAAASRPRGSTRASARTRSATSTDRLARGRAEAALRRARSASTTSASSHQLARDADRAVRGRRGPLHLRVGPQLPARLPEARGARARARRRARAGADRDRDARRSSPTSAPGSGSPTADAVVTGFYRPNLTLLTTPVAAARARRSCSIERLRERPPGSAIVYVTLQRTAERVAELLAGAGHPGAGLPRGHERRGARRRAGLVARRPTATSSSRRSRSAWASTRPTSATVYHYNLPKSLETYSQEIGRAGRDGAPAICELLACPDDVPDARELRLRRHADPRGARRPARRGARARAGRGVRRLRARALGAARHAPARAQDGADVPRARRRAAPGHAVLRGLPRCAR